MTQDITAGPLAGLFRVFSAFGGAIDNRIRIQKTAYILKMTGFQDFASLPFTYHGHGPYSRELSDVLREVVAAGLVREIFSAADQEDDRHSYQLTVAGQDWVKENGVDVPQKLLDAANTLKQFESRALELASTVLFFHRDHEMMPREHAFERALKLKPQCRAYKAKAEAIMETVVKYESCETARRALEKTPAGERVATCAGCGKETLPDTCHCGRAAAEHNAYDSSCPGPIPMGCDCHRAGTPPKGDHRG